MNMTDEQVLAKYGEKRKLRADYTKTMSEDSKIYIILIVFTGIILSLYTMAYIISRNDDIKNTEEVIAKGKAQEISNLLEVKNAKTCTDMSIILMQKFGNAYWDKKVYDQAYDEYKRRCSP